MPVGNRVRLSDLPLDTPGVEYAQFLQEEYMKGAVLKGMQDISQLVLALCARVSELEDRIEQIESRGW